ncbi:FAD-dependent oxidoreductase [Streptomyces sp. NPDC093018]|uniref:NAD(P)/FAD-dependent oxidoreductase n=1 Tax=Streptomyces sp. NPDC093018 TaxID=3155067 RepID=UPI00341C9E32
MTRERYVIAGGGVAGASAVRTLRESGFDGELVLVGDERHRPYQRPPLSKEFLAGDTDEEGLWAQPGKWYREQGVELLLGTRVTALDTVRRRLTLTSADDVDSMTYDALLLATGVRARRLPGFEGERVHYPRTLDDALALRAHLRTTDRIAVVGAGFIGCEVAATAVGLGKSVTLFEPDTVPFRRSLGPQVGSALIGIHRRQGVDVRLGTGVREVRETPGGVLVVPVRGAPVESDLVVVGVGAVPNSEIARAAGIEVHHGIVTDALGRTSHAGIWAAGDVARQYHPRYGEHLRVEHHDTAVRQGAQAARNMLGAGEEFAEPFWFWSDQYGHSVQSAGRLPDPFEPVLRGRVEEGRFSAFAWRDGKVTGVVALNRPRDVLDVRRLVFAEHEISPEQLRDESVALRRLLPRAAAARPARDRA